MSNQLNDIFGRAMIEIHNDVAKTRTSLKIEIDKDDPDPTLTVATAITEVLKNPNVVRNDQVNVGSEGFVRHALEKSMPDGYGKSFSYSSPLRLPNEFVYDDRVNCRTVFEMLNSHLDLSRDKDGWGREKYAMPHVWSEFIGWCMAIHVSNTMTPLVKMHEYAEKMAEIRNSIPKRGETKHTVHIDDFPYQKVSDNKIDVQEAADMSAEQLFNAGKRIDTSDNKVDLSSIISRTPLPDNIGAAVKQAEDIWGAGTWAALRIAAKGVVDGMGLKSWSVFQHKDGIYEDPRGGYIDRLELVRWLENRMAAHLLISAPCITGRFRPGQFVRHYKGGEYFIIAGPDNVLLEVDAKPAYVYIDKNDKIWVRDKDDFEAGVTVNPSQASPDDVVSGERVSRFSVVPVAEISKELVASAKKYCEDQVAHGFLAGFTLNFFKG